ncbi:MAG TPA: hypothetical protein VNL69_02980, partial [Bacteroidota bacterium]|nr:hypothetical protein [Bacteroidota bacterium]
LDSKPPKIKFEEYAYMETRFRMLTKSHPEEAKRLMQLAQQDVEARWRALEELAKEPTLAVPKPATATPVQPVEEGADA